MARILLVDDDSDLLEVLGEWLACRGHAVRLLTDGHLAPAVAREFAPDVVLLDGLLRGTSGPAVAEKLRAAGQRGIVFLSGLPRSELPVGVPVLEKPIDFELLQRTILRLAVDQPRQALTHSR